MAPHGLPDNVYRFVLNSVETLDALELLLLLHRESGGLTASAAGEKLKLPDGVVARRLQQLARMGVVTTDDQERFRIKQDSQQLRKDLDDLAACYAKDRTSLIHLVASRNLERLKSLADAFKLGGKS